MKKLVLFAALFAAVMPVVSAQEATEEPEVKSFCIGEFENPGKDEVLWGSGSYYERTPFQFYNRYSGNQMIFDKKYLTQLLDDNGAITEIVFKMGDEGAYVEIEADLELYIQNTDQEVFEKKEDTEKYQWKTIDMEASSISKVKYYGELWYEEDLEFHFVLDKPLKYEGKNLLITTTSHVTNDEETPALISYAFKAGEKDYKTIMMMGDDYQSFMDVYATTFQFPYQGPNNWLPVMKVYYTETTGVTGVEADATTEPRFYNLQGQEVKGDLAPGIYVRSQGSESKKVIIR